MRPRVLVFVSGALLLFGAGPAQAQDGFLFQQPRGQITVKGGAFLHRAQSDLFDFMVDTLTLQRSDFRAPWIGVDVAVLAGPALDLVLGLAWSQTESRSEFRDWDGTDGLPIEQVTRLRTIPLTLTARYHLVSRGRRVSNLAWVPNRLTPYLAGGAGMTWYTLVQDGEFVGEPVGDDPDERRIFSSRFESRDHGLTGHFGAGLDYWFTPRVGLNTEARYTIGSAPVSGAFQGWDNIDLSGFQAAIGLSFRW